ncbi:MAG: energy-coupling factor transporter transmembrane protein EcfT, partial [Christensenellaceae bacterium]|nr:energy-coupling factor transporter transmembrane protein EcfT [Christensenellaceae bacterium]
VAFFYIVSIFLVGHPFFYFISLIYLFLVIKNSGVPLKLILKGLKPLKFILVLTFVLNLFFSSGSNIIFNFYFIKITKEGLFLAVHFCVRLVLLILGTSILTLTTSPVSLSDGLEMLMRPLKRFKFPVHELAMMMTIALRFIPTLMEEADKIMKAQISRGADFETGNIFQRAKAMVPLLVPLFVSAFRRANDLAMAMEARCYHGGEGRTRFRVLKYTKDDTICVVATSIYLLIIISTMFIKI